MQRFQKICVMLALGILFTLMPALLRGQDFNDVGTVKGLVEIEDHPSLGRTPCRNCAFLIYRPECKKAIIYVRTNSDGNYEVRIGRGRWRSFSRQWAVGSGQ
jgi:hypothetical protein